MMELGEVLYPGSIHRRDDQNNLFIWVDAADTKDPAGPYQARVVWESTLGVLRAGHPLAGELAVEQRTGLGAGAIRDVDGNQFVGIGAALIYTRFGDEIPNLAKEAEASLGRSQHLLTALRLFGRADRTAADYYMVLELARDEFGDYDRLRAAVGITRSELSDLRSSLNNLPALSGGRHAALSGTPPWDLGRQRDVTGHLLRQWIQVKATP